MSDTLDENGLVIKTRPEIVTELEDGLRSIYGDDINLEQDSPDGQLVGIFAQAATDIRELARDIYSSMDPDQAQGTVLDQRVAINGIGRKGGTFTKTPVNITVDRTVTLTGLDASAETLEIPAGVYTVKDDAGTQFVLIDTVTIAAGTHSLSFRAKDIGAVLVSIDSISTAVTAIAGVTAISNTAGVTVQGVDEESDAALRIRRKRSTSIASVSFLDSIEATVLDLDGVTAVLAEENNTDVTDANGTPPHTVWVIVEGGDNTEIAEALNAKKSAGAGWRGDVTVTVERPNGRTVDIKFDRPGSEDLYLRFNVVVVGGGVIDTENLKDLIVENVLYNIGDDASVDAVVCYVKSVNEKYRVTGAEVSKDGLTWDEVVTLDAISNRFSMDTARISIS